MRWFIIKDVMDINYNRRNIIRYFVILILYYVNELNTIHCMVLHQDSGLTFVPPSYLTANRCVTIHSFRFILSQYTSANIRPYFSVWTFLESTFFPTISSFKASRASTALLFIFIFTFNFWCVNSNKTN